MKRPLCLVMIFYCIGIFLGRYYISIENLISLMIFILIIILTKIIISQKVIFGYFYILLISIISIFTGAFMFYIYDDINMKYITKFIDKPIAFECTIIDEPVVKEQNVQYLVKINKINKNSKVYNVDERAQITCYTYKQKNVYNYGDLLRITNGRLCIPSHANNKGEFDYNYYLKSKNIYITCFAYEKQVKKLGENKSCNAIIDFAHYVKRSIINTINIFIPYNEAALLKGIMLGDHSDFSKEMTERFSDIGLSHLVAVSGLHVTILLIGVTYLLNILKMNKNLINILCILFVIFFMLVTGCKSSVVRAGIMTVIFLLSYIINRESDSLNSLFFSGLVILFYNPIILFNAGFELSFCATLSILIFYKPIYNILKIFPQKIREIISATIASQICTFPIIAYHFNGISIISVISNILILPIVPIVLMSGFLLYFTGIFSNILAQLVAGFNYVFLKYILLVSSLLAKIPFASIKVQSPSLCFIIVYILGLIILYNILYNKINLIKIKVISSVLIFLIVSSLILNLLNFGILTVTFINVGQGDCTFIQSPTGKTFLIDGGGNQDKDGYDIGKNIVVPYLIKRGITKIDMAFVTHYHADHARGIISVIDSIPVKALILPLRNDSNELKKELISVAMQKGVDIYYLSREDNIKIDKDIKIQVLWPDIKYINGGLFDENNGSLVLKLVYDDVCFLFTGDIEEETENELISYYEVLKADVLKAAHHGSDTSSTENFLSKVCPKFTVICVGKNRFGHPSPEVLKRFVSIGTHVYRTDINGNITFTTNGQKIKDVKVFKEGE